MAGPVFLTPGALVADLERVIGGLVGDLARDVTVEIRDATPVDTTHARNNWVPSIGAAANVISGSRQSPDDSAQIAGLAALPAYRLAQGDIHIDNSVHYVKDLNEGSSPQAPADFVGEAIERVTKR